MKNYYRSLALILLGCLIICGCDSGFKVGDTRIEGHDMSFAIPEGFSDIQDHPDFENTALALQIRRHKGVAVVGDLGETLYSTVTLVPVGSAEDVEMNEALCEQIANQTRQVLSSRAPSLGISGSASVAESNAPGEIPDTECEFILVVGDAKYHTMNLIFSRGGTRFAASCEADSRRETLKLCDDLFYSWQY